MFCSKMPRFFLLRACVNCECSWPTIVTWAFDNWSETKIPVPRTWLPWRGGGCFSDISAFTQWVPGGGRQRGCGVELEWPEGSSSPSRVIFLCFTLGCAGNLRVLVSICHQMLPVPMLTLFILFVFSANPSWAPLCVLGSLEHQWFRPALDPGCQVPLELQHVPEAASPGSACPGSSFLTCEGALTRDFSRGCCSN